MTMTKSQEKLNERYIRFLETKTYGGGVSVKPVPISKMRFRHIMHIIEGYYRDLDKTPNTRNVINMFLDELKRRADEG